MKMKKNEGCGGESDDKNSAEPLAACRAKKGQRAVRGGTRPSR